MWHSISKWKLSTNPRVFLKLICLLQSTFLRKNHADFIYFKFESFKLKTGRHKSQVVSRQPLTAGSRIKPGPVNAGLLMALGQGFSRLHWFSPVSKIKPTLHTYSFIYDRRFKSQQQISPLNNTWILNNIDVNIILFGTRRPKRNTEKMGEMQFTHNSSIIFVRKSIVTL
jgi:hypothetical protein